MMTIMAMMTVEYKEFINSLPILKRT